jgi:hypothetical protein
MNSATPLKDSSLGVAVARWKVVLHGATRHGAIARLRALRPELEEALAALSLSDQTAPTVPAAATHIPYQHAIVEPAAELHIVVGHGTMSGTGTVRVRGLCHSPCILTCFI